jgi:hypothetical protein
LGSRFFVYGMLKEQGDDGRRKRGMILLGWLWRKTQNMSDPTALVARIISIIGFMIALPMTIATYYEAYKARQEARQARDGTLHSLNCLEFVTGDGSCINLVPLETLHSLPKPGDVVMLPGHGMSEDGEFLPGAYLVETVEHIYSHVDTKEGRPQEARLTKAVAQVTSLNPKLTV